MHLLRELVAATTTSPKFYNFRAPQNFGFKHSLELILLFDFFIPWLSFSLIKSELFFTKLENSPFSSDASEELSELSRHVERTHLFHPMFFSWLCFIFWPRPKCLSKVFGELLPIASTKFRISRRYFGRTQILCPTLLNRVLASIYRKILMIFCQ